MDRESQQKLNISEKADLPTSVKVVLLLAHSHKELPKGHGQN